jgi:hypothetical protein
MRHVTINIFNYSDKSRIIKTSTGGFMLTFTGGEIAVIQVRFQDLVNESKEALARSQELGDVQFIALWQSNIDFYSGILAKLDAEIQRMYA